VDLLGLLLPQRCSICAEPGQPLCASCRDALPRLQGPSCARCGAPTAWPVARCRECSGRRLGFGTARAAVAYNRAAAAFVADWKERGIRKLAVAAAELVAETLAPPPVEALVFVPPDGERNLKRGHHPAARLAVELGRRWQLPVANVLGRTRALPRQRGLSRDERRKNVAGAFVARATALPRRISLVDDVYTTGATASAAASALRRAGALEVHVVTFARAVRLGS
jgi:ComF family protein